jgi:hypothetical protein
MLRQQLKTDFFPMGLIKMVPLCGFVDPLGQVLDGGGHGLGEGEEKE